MAGRCFLIPYHPSPLPEITPLIKTKCPKKVPEKSRRQNERSFWVAGVFEGRAWDGLIGNMLCVFHSSGTVPRAHIRIRGAVTSTYTQQFPVRSRGNMGYDTSHCSERGENTRSLGTFIWWCLSGAGIWSILDLRRNRVQTPVVKTDLNYWCEPYSSYAFRLCYSYYSYVTVYY